MSYSGERPGSYENYEGYNAVTEETTDSDQFLAENVAWYDDGAWSLRMHRPVRWLLDLPNRMVRLIMPGTRLRERVTMDPTHNGSLRSAVNWLWRGEELHRLQKVLNTKS